MSTFDLERRAAEIVGCGIGKTDARDAAIQFARELAEAIAATIGAGPCAGSKDAESFRKWAAGIARSFARPRTREEVCREALEQLRNGRWTSDGDADGYCGRVVSTAQRALDEAAKVKP